MPSMNSPKVELRNNNNNNRCYGVMVQSATISLMKQVQHHRTAVSRIHRILGNKNKKASSYLGRCLHTVGIGSNDYLNNYFLPKYYNSSRIYTPEQFATDLVDRLLFPQLDVSMVQSFFFSHFVFSHFLFIYGKSSLYRTNYQNRFFKRLWTFRFMSYTFGFCVNSTIG